jgi:hypothetical protein
MILRPVAPPVEYGITKRLARAGNALVLLLEDGSGFLTMETGDLLLLE